MKNKSLKPISIEAFNQIRHINDVKFCRGGNTVYWVETINGKGVIFQRGMQDQPEIISGDNDVRGNVGYGGGEFDVGNTILVFTRRNGGLFKTDLNHLGDIQSISPCWGNIAAPSISPDEKWVLYVYQDGETDGVAITHTHGLTWPSQLILGADFYMQPTWHPTGEKIAWVEWNHPDMPWDGSRVKIGIVGGMQLRLFEEHWIDGGKGFAACQPQFSPDGKWLSYIRRSGNWDSLIIYNLKKRQKRTVVPADGYHLCLPNWIQGMRSYGWSADSKYIYYLRYLHGKSTLWKVNIKSGISSNLDITPITWATQLHVSTTENELVFLGASTQTPKEIYTWRNKQLTTLVKNEVEELKGFSLSLPQEISFKAGDESEVFGIYYPTANYENELPALILDVHGGPTSLDYQGFSNDAIYFTSRGYAYAQINYRGSSGYGYAYQDALEHHWGEVDVEDAVDFAKELVKRGLADPSKLVIKGSSAGGFTVLNVLIKYPSMFKTGICSYGIGNLIEDAKNTHKFERYYHRFLTGDLEKDHQRFIDRSPIFHIDNIKDPVALFHGDSDKVVSPAQSVEIYNQLTRRGITCLLKIYEGEGHGFRKTDTLKDYYLTIEDFLNQHLSRIK